MTGGFVVSAVRAAKLGEIAKTNARHAIGGVPVCVSEGFRSGIVTEGVLVHSR